MEESALNSGALPTGVDMGQLSDETGALIDFPLEGVSENVRDFLDMIDYYQTIKALNVDELGQSVTAGNKTTTFCQAFERISRGCGCQRKNRMKEAESSYLDVANLSEGEQKLIKDALNVETVRIFLNGGLFAEF
jgi:hypothetical protein